MIALNVLNYLGRVGESGRNYSSHFAEKTQVQRHVSCAWGHSALSWDAAGFQSRAVWLQKALFPLTACLGEGQAQTDGQSKPAFQHQGSCLRLPVCKASPLNYPAWSGHSLQHGQEALAPPYRQEKHGLERWNHPPTDGAEPSVSKLRASGMWLWAHLFTALSLSYPTNPVSEGSSEN